MTKKEIALIIARQFVEIDVEWRKEIERRDEIEKALGRHNNATKQAYRDCNLVNEGMIVLEKTVENFGLSHRVWFDAIAAAYKEQQEKKAAAR